MIVLQEIEFLLRPLLHRAKSAATRKVRLKTREFRLLRCDLICDGAERLGTSTCDLLGQDHRRDVIGCQRDLDALEGRRERDPEERRDLLGLLQELSCELGIVGVDSLVDRLLQAADDLEPQLPGGLPDRDLPDLGDHVVDRAHHLGSGELDVLADELELVAEALREIEAGHLLLGVTPELLDRDLHGRSGGRDDLVERRNLQRRAPAVSLGPLLERPLDLLRLAEWRPGTAP